MDPEALKNLSPAQKEEIMTAVQQQVALANMQVPPLSYYRPLAYYSRLDWKFPKGLIG